MTADAETEARLADQPSRGYRAAVAVREIVLWIGAVVGVVCLVAAAAALLFGITPLIFRSGSMSPAIPTGALALAKTTPASELRPGDVVSALRADGERVTHRLVTSTQAGGDRYALTVKGDANAEADPEPIIAAEADRVFWSAPDLGYVAQFASKPQVLLPVGALFGMLLVIGFRPPLDKRLLRDPRGLAVVGALVVSATVVGTTQTTSTLAAFTDTGSATANFSTASLQAPATFTCSVVGGQIRFAWTMPATSWPAASFTITNITNGLSTTVTPGTARTVDVAPPLISLGSLTTYYYTIRANDGSGSSATSSQQRTVIALLGLLPTCS